jgi:hypothetical protein
MKRATLILAALVALTLAADADAKRGRKRQQAPEPVPGTWMAPPAETAPVCGAHCVPAEWTLIEGTTCDYLRAECTTDVYGFPACWFHVKSCD